MSKGEDIKVRVPSAMKAAFVKLGKADLTGESTHARKAFLQYLLANGYTLEQLQDATVSSAKPAVGAGRRLIRDLVADVRGAKNPGSKKSSLPAK